MMKLKGLILLVVVSVFSSCSKELIVSKNVDGTYRGVFEIENTDPAANSTPITADVWVNLKGINYNSTGSVNGISAGASGKYFIKKDVITFTDILMHTANFDWSLLLNGSYTYTIKDDQIVLSKKAGNNTYTYRLKKQ
jgi:hypothetical protein